MQDSVRFLLWCLWHGAVEHRNSKAGGNNQEVVIIEHGKAISGALIKTGKHSAVIMVSWVSKDPGHGPVPWNEQAELVTTCRYSVWTCHNLVTGS